MTNKANILFICKGNICRSPLAEAILRKKIDQNELSGLCMVQSAAIKDYHIGKGADPNAILVGKNNGYDLTKHVVSMVEKEKVEWADLIVIMDNENRDGLLDLFGPDVLNKIKFIISFINGCNHDVIDPFKKSYKEFEEAFAILEDACEHIIEHLKKEAIV